MKETLRKKTVEYMQRAEVLKELLTEAKKPQAVTANGASKKYERPGPGRPSRLAARGGLTLARALAVRRPVASQEKRQERVERRRRR